MHLTELHLLLTGQLGATVPQPEGILCPPPRANPPCSALRLGSADMPAMPVIAAGHHGGRLALLSYQHGEIVTVVTSAWGDCYCCHTGMGTWSSDLTIANMSSQSQHWQSTTLAVPRFAESVLISVMYWYVTRELVGRCW